MAPTVQLKLGDMFDGPSDLIVLPCSTAGTVTSFVRRNLVQHRISYPSDRMQLGQVDIRPFIGGENIAQYVAFAASVDDLTSTEAIAAIGEKLGSYTKENGTVRLIAAPLLGTGAGGLKPGPSVLALRDGFIRAAAQDATIVIHVLTEEVLSRVRSAFVKPAEIEPRTSTVSTPERALRVFISYTETSPEHGKWVEQLATFLRAHGVNARLDIWHLRRGMDVPQFMCNEVTMADKIVIVCNKAYAERADGRLGGVGWETMLIQGDIARLPPEYVKYLAVVHDADLKSSLPVYLRTKYAIHWPGPFDQPDKCRVLLEELHNVLREPPLVAYGLVPERGPMPTEAE